MEYLDQRHDRNANEMVTPKCQILRSNFEVGFG